MFSSSPNYAKLKTNLRLAISRLKLLEKKKTELAQKARREISEYIANNKIERAKIRVEYIIREDYLVEAMELVEMYCDLLLARFGLLQQMKNLDEGLAEAITSLIWAAPRMQSDISELKQVVEILSLRFDKQFIQNCRDGTENRISEKLKQKLSIQSPPKILVERYLIEIAKSHNIQYKPDPQILNEDGKPSNGILIEFDGDKLNNLDENFELPKTGLPHPPGFIDFPSMPLLSFPSTDKSSDFAPSTSSFYPGSPYSVPPKADDATSPHVTDTNPTQNIPNIPPHHVNVQSGYINLPNVPEDLPDISNPDDNEDNIDFDDLTKRFEELKKKK